MAPDQYETLLDALEDVIQKGTAYIDAIRAAARYKEILERDKVLRLADQIIYAELGTDWSLDAHMARKSQILAEVDA